MFETYTEKARRVIFFARYQASQFGSSSIETEHLLLSLLLKDKLLGPVLKRRTLAKRDPNAHPTVESIREQIERQTTVRHKVATSVDLLLSNESKRVLAYAVEEAQRLSHKQIGTGHLLLGLLREEKCAAARMLLERGIDFPSVREELGRVVQDSEVRERALETSLLLQLVTNLSEDTGQFQPLVGRESELKEVIHVLCRSTRRNSSKGIDWGDAASMEIPSRPSATQLRGAFGVRMDRTKTIRCRPRFAEFSQFCPRITLGGAHRSPRSLRFSRCCSQVTTCRSPAVATALHV